MFGIICNKNTIFAVVKQNSKQNSKQEDSKWVYIAFNMLFLEYILLANDKFQIKDMSNFSEMLYAEKLYRSTKIFWVLKIIGSFLLPYFENLFLNIIIFPLWNT